jgi:hypothetical protein
MTRDRALRARVLILFALALVASACTPIFRQPGDGSHPRDIPVRQWDRFEADYTPARAPANPFDPAEIDVRAVVTPPRRASFEVPAFWFQDYTRALVNGREVLTPKGTPHFKVRFTPDTAGRWRWHWVIRTGGTTTVSEDQYLRVQRAPGRGFLRTSTRDSRYLAFDNGEPYFAVGENTGWYDARGTYAYDDWFERLADQGANFGRIWMSSWAFGVEWNDTGLGDYTERLDRAWQLDRVLDEAERRDIYVMFALLNHGAFSTVFNGEWDANPYNAANRGPLATPAEFFTNAEARALFERRLRYVVARWGWSTRVQSWELWNEVDLTDGYNSNAITTWHAHMAGVLRALDPNDHLVTSSHAVFASDPNVWNNGGLDFTQLHFYANTIPPFSNLAKTVTTWTNDRWQATHKPVLFGELGVDSRGPAETKANDPQGIGVHDGLWAGPFSGGFGTAMPWWWDNLIATEPARYYPMFGSVARFVDGVAWDREGFLPEQRAATASGRPVAAYALRGDNTLLLWVRDDAFQWNAPNDPLIVNAHLAFGGRWCGSWYDTWTGKWLQRAVVRDAISVPPFRRDIAFRATACGHAR